jgi:hypothetical protein
VNGSFFWKHDQYGFWKQDQYGEFGMSLKTVRPVSEAPYSAAAAAPYSSPLKIKARWVWNLKI